MTTLADAAKAARLRSGLTQSGLAEKAGVTQSTISRIEAGQSPGITTLAAIAKALGVTIESLLPKSRRKSRAA